MKQSNPKWELDSADAVAQAADWVRRRGNALLVIAIGPNSVVYAKDAALSAEDATDIVQRQVPTLQRGFERLGSQRVTRGYSRRED